MNELREPAPKELAAAAARVRQVQEIRAAQERESQRRALLTRDDIRSQFRKWIEDGTYTYGDASDFVRDCQCISAEERETFIRGTYAELTSTPTAVAPAVDVPDELPVEEEPAEEEPAQGAYIVVRYPATDRRGVPFMLPFYCKNVPKDLGVQVGADRCLYLPKRRGSRGGRIPWESYFRPPQIRKRETKPVLVCRAVFMVDGIKYRVPERLVRMNRHFAEQRFLGRQFVDAE